MYRQCLKDIENYKRKLDGKPVVENFGRDYVRKLQDKYLMEGYRDNRIFDVIDNFDDWCATYTGR